jgi:two-component system cell cycle sensor histidine kinase/response regulator CckA
VSLEVRDSGGGMPPEVLERIFEPFFTTRFTGRGLGLSAVLGIVRGHHGALDVESMPGSGSRFRILLPASAYARATAQPPRGSAATVHTRRHTVLLVDGEEMVREVATAMLERLGHRVLVAANGTEALSVYRTHWAEIGCVILDLTMPGPNSDEVVRAMRATNSRVRIVISSGFTEPDVATRMPEIDTFLQKPYELSQLREGPGGCARQCQPGTQRPSQIGRSCSEAHLASLSGHPALSTSSSAMSRACINGAISSESPPGASSDTRRTPS